MVSGSLRLFPPLKLVAIIKLGFWCFNATFSNISALLWRPVLVVEKVGENH
jgi:hypothetical protein